LDESEKDSVLAENLKKLISMSLANSTWKKYNTGFHALLDFEKYENKHLAWPLSIETWRKFTVWCVTIRKISSSTVKSYFTSIILGHSLQNLQCQNPFDDKIISMTLNGAKNVTDLFSPKKNVRRVMTYSTLLILSHKIANSNWDKLSKQVFWTACTLAFYASLRLGEVCSAYCDRFDVNTTLVWKNVKFLNLNEVLLFLPYTKTGKCAGDFVDVFPTNDITCPTMALRKLLSVQIEMKVFDMQKPVFMFSSGKLLTVRHFNQVVKDLLQDLYVPGENQITAHSFRAGLPAFLNSMPDIFSKQDIQQQGRWSGDSYKLYLRLHRNNRRVLFNKVNSVISENKV
jgi:hypothetical protein